MSAEPADQDVEHVARAIDPLGWAWYDRTDDTHPARRHWLAAVLKQARAAIAAIRERAP